MIKIGLTGGFGSGKSLVSDAYRQAQIPIIDADEIARIVVKQSSPTLKQIQEIFGDKILEKDGTLNRLRLAEIIFKNNEAREKLNKIIHPAILKQMNLELSKHERAGDALVIVDAPLLFETGLDKKMDVTIVVWTPEDICLSRLVQYRGFTEEEARLRMEAQMSIEEKRQKADYIIDNAGSIEATREQSLALLKEIREKAITLC